MQKAIWHLSAGDLAESVQSPLDTSAAAADADALRAALRTLLQVAWSSISAEGSVLFDDFASFARLTLADAAETVEAQAARAKTSLRTTEDEVQDGTRDSLGNPKRSQEEQQRDADVRVQWESGMDSIKDTGSAAIGAGQSAKATAEDVADKGSSRVQEGCYKVRFLFLASRRR